MRYPFPYDVKGSQEAARKTVTAMISNEDAEELERVEPEKMVEDEVLHHASKVFTATAMLESCFKAVSIVESYESEGPGVAEEKLKSRMGLSASDDSDVIFEKAMMQINHNLNAIEKELNKRNKKKNEQDSDEGEDDDGDENDD